MYAFAIASKHTRNAGWKESLMILILYCFDNILNASQESLRYRTSGVVISVLFAKVVGVQYNRLGAAGLFLRNPSNTNTKQPRIVRGAMPLVVLWHTRVNIFCFRTARLDIQVPMVLVVVSISTAFLQREPFAERCTLNYLVARCIDA